MKQLLTALLLCILHISCASADINSLGNGLIGHWISCSGAKDCTPYGNNGTVVNATLTSDAHEIANKAYYFNGVNSSITIGAVSKLNNTTKATFSGWFYKSAANTDLYFGSYLAAGNGIWLQWYSDNNIYFNPRNGATSISRYASYSNVGNWVHIAGVYDGTLSESERIKIFVNGNQMDVTASGTIESSLSSTVGNSFMIGVAVGNYSKGKLSDVRVYNRALSTAEVKQLYNSYNPDVRVNSLSNGLIGHWDLNGNAKDKTPYQNNGTVVNAVLSTDAHGVANGSYYFNGDDAYIDTNNSVSLSTKDFTVACWFKGVSPGYSVSQLRTVAPASDFSLGGAGSALFWMRTVTLGLQSTVQDGNWHHIAMVWSVAEAKYKGYTDGVLIGQSTTVSDYGGIGTIKIGVRGDGLSSFAEGSIDDVRIYQRQLSATEILQLKNSYNPTLNTNSLGKGLVTYLDMNGNAKDKTPNGNDGTVTGPVLTTDIHGRANSAYAWDKTLKKIELPIVANNTLNGDFTVSIRASRVYADETTATTCYVLNMEYATNSKGVLRLSFTRLTGTTTVTMYNGSAGIAGTYTTSSPQNDTWNTYTVRYVKSANTIELFVNGVSFGTKDMTGALPIDTGTIRIGYMGATNTYYNGSMDDFMVYNRALSDAEILQISNSYY